MSMRYLGETLDIHGGGLDLQFPHHENELAQSESYTGKPFARYWMHNGLMKMGTEKMSKSKGNEVVVTKLLERVPAETLRFLLLSTHYRRPIEFSEEHLQEIQRGMEAFHRFFERYERITGERFHQPQAPTRRGEFPAANDFLEAVARHRERFLECMDDDFNTGGSVGVLYELLTTVNRFADTKQLEGPGKADEAARADFRKAATALKELVQILGVFREPAARTQPGGDDKLVNGLLQLLVDLRAECRKAKNFAMSDQIRNRLQQLGVTLEDRPGGTTWRVQ
jgi:cysteinyl-tRNA synthetase